MGIIELARGGSIDGTNDGKEHDKRRFGWAAQLNSDYLKAFFEAAKIFVEFFPSSR